MRSFLLVNIWVFLALSSLVSQTMALATKKEISICKPSEEGTVQGQTIINHIRDVAAVRNLGSQFGKTASAVLKREVVPKNGVEEGISKFMRDLLNNTERLTVLVADIGGDNRDDTITVTAGYSCLDHGLSNGTALSWWTAKSFAPLTNISAMEGSANQEPSADITENINALETDISVQCWCKGKDLDLTTEKFRLVRNDDQHKGKGVYYKRFDEEINGPKKINLSYHFFEDLRKIGRSIKINSSEYDYYKDTPMPIVNGLPFDNGVRIRTHPNVPYEISQPEHRVPATVHMSNRAHVGARLSEAHVSPGESRTTGPLFIISFLGSGLAIVVSTWAVFKVVGDGAVERTIQLRRQGVRAAVHGRAAIDVASRMVVLLQILTLVFVGAPLVQAVLEGVADPRASVEVTTIATVFYSKSYPNEPTLSNDNTNLIAGAAFQVLVSVTYRKLDDGFLWLLIPSTIMVILFSTFVILRERFRVACILLSAQSRRHRFSFWRTAGYLRLKYMPRRASSVSGSLPRQYRVFVEFRDDLIWHSLEEISALLVTKASERIFANRPLSRSQALREEMRRERSAEKLQIDLEASLNPSRTFGLTASIRLHDEDRLAAMLAKNKIWQAPLPRSWYWITASAGNEAPTIEWYRCRGIFMHDSMLLPARMGLLDYMDKVKRVSFRDATPEECNIDVMDKVRVQLFDLPRINPGHHDFISSAEDCAVQFQELAPLQNPYQFNNGRLIDL